MTNDQYEKYKTFLMWASFGGVAFFILLSPFDWAIPFRYVFGYCIIHFILVVNAKYDSMAEKNRILWSFVIAIYTIITFGIYMSLVPAQGHFGVVAFVPFLIGAFYFNFACS